MSLVPFLLCMLALGLGTLLLLAAFVLACERV
jgi:hypothetical protein